jgi:pimeloyl-ACP methyl ester carboxylesterase
MNDIQKDNPIPGIASYVQQGKGAPVILIHGLAASLHDWDDLMPELAAYGYSAYAVDLLGHGESPKPESRAYQVEWLLDHFAEWMRSLRLTEPAVVIGHSLGGYVALEYARRVSTWTRGLVLVNPFFTRSQLPFLLRNTYRHPRLSGWVVGRTPQWLFRFFVDMSSVAMGHSIGALHSLPEHIRTQTVIDYKRTAPGVYHIPNIIPDMDEFLPEINVPTLVVWGDRDLTLAPDSFPRLVKALPNARGEFFHAGHVPHQSNIKDFNQLVLQYLKELP